MEGAPRASRQESNEQDQEKLAIEYLNLNKQRETISVETMNLLKNLDNARNEQFLAGDFGKTEVERLEASFKESYAKEKPLMEQMGDLLSKMTEATKDKYLKAK